MSDDEAAQLAAAVLSKNKGSIGGTIQQLIHTAISSSSDSSNLQQSQQQMFPWHPSFPATAPATAIQEGLHHANAMQYLHSQLQNQGQGIPPSLLGGYDTAIPPRPFLHNSALGGVGGAIMQGGQSLPLHAFLQQQ